MRTLAFWIASTAALAGCISAGTPGPSPASGGTDCPTPGAAPAASGIPIEVQVADSMTKGTCVRVYFDGTLVAAGTLPGETTGLHNNPRKLASFTWGEGAALVKVQADAPGGTHEERVQLVSGKTNYVVAWVDEAGTTIRVYDSEPRWT